MTCSVALLFNERNRIKRSISVIHGCVIRRARYNSRMATTRKVESTTPGPNKLPARFVQFQKRYPKLFEAYDALGNASAEAGPLDGKTRALVKLALAVGGQMEGAVHSHTRRALESGCSPDEIRHVTLLAVTTLGFPTMMKTLSWVEDVIGTGRQQRSE
jgi:4-carboxymuconolactone decarboxylase